MKVSFLVCIIFIFLTACTDSNVKKIQEGYLDFDKSITIKYALDQYKDCSKLSWESLNKDGKDYVIATCDVTNTAKEEVKNTYNHYKNINYQVTANFIKSILDNLDFFNKIEQKFIFVLNKDGSYKLDDIKLDAIIDGDKQANLFANNPDLFMKNVYKEHTLSKLDSLNYVSYLQNFILISHPEFKDKFKLDIKNPLPSNERINANAPFGLKLGKDDIQEAFSKIPCLFEESKFINGIFQNNGYYITYDNCYLVDGMQNLNLGFDDNKKLIYVAVEFNKSVANYKLRNKFQKEGLSIKSTRYTNFFNEAFRAENPKSSIIIESSVRKFNTYLDYYLNQEIYNKITTAVDKKNKQDI